MNSKCDAYKFIDMHRQSMLKLWQSLVNVDCGPDAPEGVEKVSMQIADFLKELNFSTRFIRFKNTGNMLIAEQGDMSRPFIVFTGHMDSIFSRGAAAARSFHIKDNKAYGPGVLDMKGGIVISLYVLAALKSIGYDKYPIKIIFAGDEETGHKNSTAPEKIMEEANGAFAAFNFETGFPGNGIVVERKGMYQFSLEVFGRGAHVGNDPGNGRNAIREIAHKILDIEALTDWAAGNTFNVGVVEGGTVCNAVPAYAKIVCDLRFVSSSKLPSIKQKLKGIASKTYIDGTQSALTDIVEFKEMERLDSSMKLFQKIEKTARTEGFKPFNTIAVGGASDSAYLTRAGIPTLCAMGVIGEHNHTVEEFAYVDSLYERAKFLSAALIDL